MLLLELICALTFTVGVVVPPTIFLVVCCVSMGIINDICDLSRFAKLGKLFKMFLVSFVASLLLGVAIFVWPLTFMVAIYYVTSGSDNWIRKIGPWYENFINNFIG